MIPFAPIARLVDWFTRDDVWRELRKHQASPIGVEAATIARQNIEASEFGGNNRGPDVERFRSGYGGHGAWCAAFVCYCLEKASEARGAAMPFERTHGARKLFRRAVASGWLVDASDIQVGDLVLWARGRKAWQGHIGIVSQAAWNDRGKVKSWHYIAGNEGNYPAPVKERRGHTRRLIGFARVS